jgi:hypothetical protein
VDRSEGWLSEIMTTKLRLKSVHGKIIN